MRGTSVDYERPYRPLVMALANRVGKVLGRSGIVGVDLGEEALVAAARRRTRLDDLGEEWFREPMRVLLESVVDEASLHPVGRVMARENLVRLLSNRLRIEETLGRHPEILEVEIEDPVVITGLQRTGTTLLHRMMACDPANRVLYSWEAVNPAPWKGAGEREARVRAARLAAVSVRFLAPDFAAIHPVDAESTEEDVLLLEYCFMSTVPESLMRVSRYSRWVEGGDHVRAYRYLERVLKLLTWYGGGGRWLLKSPHHLEHLDAFFEVFPGARIVQTHRDPTVVLASFCSMISHARGIFSDDPDPEDVGRHWMRKQVRMVERAMAVRDSRFLDVMYADLARDPVAEVRRVYRFLGRDLDEVVERRMRRYVSENPQHKHGRHNYGLAHFGLSEPDVSRRFGPYRERFRIPREGA